MKALVLAGGKGTRLRPLTYAMAKQLVPVANKPILHYAMNSLYEGGIRDFGIIISPETGDAIQQSLQGWRPDGARLTFILQDSPAGLAHAVNIAEPYLQTDSFLMYLGDNLINADLRSHIQEFEAQALDASILLKAVPNPSSFGVAELGEWGQVIRLVEKPAQPRSNLALVGVYLFNHRIFDAIQRIQPSARGELEITDAIQRLIDDRAAVHARIHDGWWLDTGKKDDLLAANEVVLNDWLQTRIDGAVDDRSRLTGTVEISPGATIINSRLIGPCAIGPDCVIENAFIGPHVSIGHGCAIRDAAIVNSVVLERCEIDSVRGKIEDSLIGSHCRVGRSHRHPETGQESFKFLLADHSDIHTL